MRSLQRVNKARIKKRHKITLSIDEIMACYQFIDTYRIHQEGQEIRLFFGELHHEIINLDTNNVYIV